MGRQFPLLSLLPSFPSPFPTPGSHLWMQLGSVGMLWVLQWLRRSLHRQTLCFAFWAERHAFGDTTSTNNGLFVSRISKKSMKIADDLVKSRMSYHYWTPPWSNLKRIGTPRYPHESRSPPMREIVERSRFPLYQWEKNASLAYLWTYGVHEGNHLKLHFWYLI